MNVLMIGVDKTSVGGMLTVVENYLNDEAFCNKTNLRYIPSVINSTVLKKIIFFIKSIFRIAFCIVCKKIDIVHIHMAERTSVYREGLIARLAKFLGCKVVIHMHGANIETWYNAQPPKVKRIAAYFMNAADKMIVLGNNWVPFMEKVVNNESKITVVYNAVPSVSSNLYSLKSKDVIFLGMLIQRKGIEDLLRAFSFIKNEIPEDITLKLYGDDKNHNIKNLIERYNLVGRAEFCGWLTNEEKPSVLMKCILNVLPSYNEGLPMTILETMAYGIPNISTNIAAIPELINDGVNGLLITPGDVESLKKALLDLLLNDEKRTLMSDNAYESIQGNFTVKKHLQNILDIYKELIVDKK